MLLEEALAPAVATASVSVLVPGPVGSGVPAAMPSIAVSALRDALEALVPNVLPRAC